MRISLKNSKMYQSYHLSYQETQLVLRKPMTQQSRLLSYQQTHLVLRRTMMMKHKTLKIGVKKFN